MTKKNRKTRRNGRGTVLIISAMLLTSAILRLGSGAGEVLAEASEQFKEPNAEMIKDASTSTNTPEVTAQLDRPQIAGLLAALQEREERVKRLENQIDVRSKALAVADAEITKRLGKLEEAEANLRRTLALADGAAEDDLARLTSVYENMKPKDAAALFSAMEPDFAAGFLGRMRPDAAAAIMTGLAPDVAYSISVILAGRNAMAPKS